MQHPLEWRDLTTSLRLRVSAVVCLFASELALCLTASLLLAAPASARRVARRDPIEPLLTTPAFLDQSAEFGIQWSKNKGGREIELAAGIEWIFWDRLELSMDIPTAINDPDHGATVGDLSDIGFAAQVLLCCETHRPLDYFSIRTAVEAPTGDRSKDIGGDGSWEMSLLPGRYFTVTDRLAAVLAQAQIGYTQQIRVDGEGLDTAHELGISKTRQKEFIWNIAVAQPYFDGVVQPVFEILGTTVVDALEKHDEGTIVELSVGLWLAPHPREHFLSALSYGLGVSFPVTSLKEDQSVVLFTVEWALD
jgi:hypothetical protein